VWQCCDNIAKKEVPDAPLQILRGWFSPFPRIGFKISIDEIGHSALVFFRWRYCLPSPVTFPRRMKTFTLSRVQLMRQSHPQPNSLTSTIPTPLHRA